MKAVVSTQAQADALMAYMDAAMGYPLPGVPEIPIPGGFAGTAHATYTIAHPTNGSVAVVVGPDLDAAAAQLASDPTFLPALPADQRVALLAAYASAVELTADWFPPPPAYP